MVIMKQARFFVQSGAYKLAFGHFLQLLYAELLEQHGAFFGAYAGDIFQLAAVSFGAEISVVSDGEPMGFIAYPLQKLKRGIVARQHYRLRIENRVYLLLALGKAYHRDIQTARAHGSVSRRKLTFAAVYYNEVRLFVEFIVA